MQGLYPPPHYNEQRQQQQRWHDHREDREDRIVSNFQAFTPSSSSSSHWDRGGAGGSQRDRGGRDSGGGDRYNNFSSNSYNSSYNSSSSFRSGRRSRSYSRHSRSRSRNNDRGLTNSRPGPHHYYSDRSGGNNTFNGGGGGGGGNFRENRDGYVQRGLGDRQRGGDGDSLRISRERGNRLGRHNNNRRRYDSRNRNNNNNRTSYYDRGRQESRQRYDDINNYRNRNNSRDRDRRNRQSSRDNRGFGNGRDGNKNRSRSSSRSGDSDRSSDIDDSVGHFDPTKDPWIANRYHVESELGVGTFGKVFLCRRSEGRAGKGADNTAATITSVTGEVKKYAVKVVRSIDRYVDSAKIEAEIMEKVSKAQRALWEVDKSRQLFCLDMLEHFAFNGHYCMVLEPLGKSMYHLVKANNYVGFPADIIHAVSRQMIASLEFLKSIELIHTDLKLENILFVTNNYRMQEVIWKSKRCLIEVPVDHRIKLIDFGGATFDHDQDKSQIVNTRQYRSPEVILEIMDSFSSPSTSSSSFRGENEGGLIKRKKNVQPMWSYPSDMWSMACIICELYSGDLLFPTHGDLEHLCLIEKVCLAGYKWKGSRQQTPSSSSSSSLEAVFPEYMLANWEVVKDFFHSKNHRLRSNSLSRSSQRAVDDLLTPDLIVGQVASYREDRSDNSNNNSNSHSYNSSNNSNGSSGGGPTPVALDDKDEQLVDLLFRMLVADPKKRITPEIALTHEYFN